MPCNWHHFSTQSNRKHAAHSIHELIFLYNGRPRDFVNCSIRPREDPKRNHKQLGSRLPFEAQHTCLEGLIRAPKPIGTDVFERLEAASSPESLAFFGAPQCALQKVAREAHRVGAAGDVGDEEPQEAADLSDREGLESPKRLCFGGPRQW